jgi:glycosyltransferase involved in cell wall biosynthesis
MQKDITMRIAWFHGNMKHTNSGGVRFVVDYAIGLKQLFNNDVSVFCDQASDEVVARLKSAGITVIITDHTSTNNPLYWLTLPARNRLKQTKLAYIDKEFDCIVNTLFPMNMLVSKFKLPKVQMCYEPFAFFYDPDFLKHFTLPQQIFFRLMKALYERSDKTAVAMMEQLLTVNKTNLSKIERIYCRKATPVYAGIDPNVYKRAAPDAIELIRKKHPGQPLLFHSTDLTGIKGTYPLLEIIKRILPTYPTIKLLITVYIDRQDGINRLKKRIKVLGLDLNVAYLGCLPREQLPIYYSAVDFVCQPSLNQPANWPLKEAMLCETPIIGGSESEEVDDRNGVKIDVCAIDQSVKLLDKLFARDRASFFVDTEILTQQYSIEACLTQFNDVLVSVCK